jgi:Fic-DOC domain mobile mystery protein B
MEYPPGATPLDPNELEGLRFPHVETRAELDQLEQQNIQGGLLWLSRQRKFKDFLSDEFAKELHKRLFGAVWKWAGCFRKTEKNLGVDPLQICVELRNLLDDTRYWIDHQTYPPFEFAARFHHRLVQIHLFPNGNGRHSRIMTDVLLEKYLVEPAINWRNDALIGDSEYREIYINALRRADAEDYTQLIEFLGRKRAAV